MPIENYGVWKATPTKFTAQRNGQDSHSPHGTLVFEDGESSEYLSAAINVKSLSADSRLVYWPNHKFSHPLQDPLQSLDFGFHAIRTNDPGLGLDLLRSDVVDVSAGQLVQHDVPGENNDIIDFLNPFFQKAIQSNATVYIYGEQFGGRDGVHDVHMNQGSDGNFRDQNGVYQDGGIIVEYSDGDWEAFFIAFASQATKTDDDGQPDGPTFAEVLGGNGNRGGHGNHRGHGSHGRHGNHGV